VSASVVIVLAGSSLEALGFKGWEAGPLLGFAGISSPIQSLCQQFHGWGDSVMYPGIVLAILVAIRGLVRRAWLGNVVWLALALVLMSGAQFDHPGMLVAGLAVLTAFLFLLTRFGFLAVVAFTGILGTMEAVALTMRPRDWYFTSGLMSLLLLALLVIWGYRAAVGGRAAAT